jgi:hypothetical protein
VTGVYTLAPGTNVSGISQHTLRHDRDLHASQVTICDPSQNTRRGLSYGRDVRDIAHVIVADKDRAMMVNIARGGPDFQLTLNPMMTGKESMTGVWQSRDGGTKWPVEEGVDCKYHKIKDGRLEEWTSGEAGSDKSDDSK